MDKEKDIVGFSINKEIKLIDISDEIMEIFKEDINKSKEEIKRLKEEE